MGIIIWAGAVINHDFADFIRKPSTHRSSLHSPRINRNTNEVRVVQNLALRMNQSVKVAILLPNPATADGVLARFES
jgi:hypothetical protein